MILSAEQYAHTKQVRVSGIRSTMKDKTCFVVPVLGRVSHSLCLPPFPKHCSAPVNFQD